MKDDVVAFFVREISGGAWFQKKRRSRRYHGGHKNGNKILCIWAPWSSLAADSISSLASKFTAGVSYHCKIEHEGWSKRIFPCKRKRLRHRDHAVSPLFAFPLVVPATATHYLSSLGALSRRVCISILRLYLRAACSKPRLESATPLIPTSGNCPVCFGPQRS